MLLRSVYERFSFWGLACHACGSRDGWRIIFCGWRSNSYIAAATCRQCGAEQFLKKYRRRGDGDGSMAQWEYEVLRQLVGRSEGESGFFLPRVYNLAPHTYALSMEYISGATLDERIRVAPHRERFDNCLRIAASWLRRLHTLAPIHDRAGNGSGEILEQLESNCASLTGHNPMVAQALTYMRQSLDAIDDLSAERVVLHGDFKASNLIWTEKGVYGIDLGMRFKNPAAMDIAQFIVNVLLNRRRIPAIAGDREVGPIVDVFLQGYGDNREAMRKLTAWWLLCFLLSRWQGEGWKTMRVANRNYTATLEDVMNFCGSHRR
jgi:tRNA A-37 threonylcarbamoyl transferase component Bud32